MRLIKRALLFGCEIGISIFGIIVSTGLGVLVGQFTSSQSSLPLLAFVFGLLLSTKGLLLFRRKTRPWKIAYDAIGWELSRAERKLHPSRARYKRMVRRTLVCVPSAIAALVLFFFPAASHILNPQWHYLKRYRVPIPWTVTVFAVRGLPAERNSVVAFVSNSGRSRFGMTPFWGAEGISSFMSFETVNQVAPSVSLINRP